MKDFQMISIIEYKVSKNLSRIDGGKENLYDATWFPT